MKNALVSAESALFYAKTEGEFDTEATKLQVDQAYFHVKGTLEQYYGEDPGQDVRCVNCSTPLPETMMLVDPVRGYLCPVCQ